MNDRTTTDFRVLIIVQNLPVPGDRRVWLQCQALRRAGYQVSVISPRATDEADHEVRDGIYLHKYDPPPPTMSTRDFFKEFVTCWWKTLRLVRYVAEHEGFDVIQACNPPDTYWLIGRIYKRRGIPFVFDQHDLCPELYQSRFDRPNPVLLAGLRWLEKRTYRTADHVISTNESYRQVAKTRGGKSDDQVTVVRSGPSERLRRVPSQPRLRRGHRHLACYVGVMGPQDGVDVALHAIAHYVHVLGRDDTFFALMGSGDCRSDLLRLAKDLRIEHVVWLPGRVSDAVLFEYLSTASVGLCPDPMNPLNDVSTMNKTMEYMAFGIPFVAFDLRETRVSGGSAGVYVPHQQGAEGFARALGELLDRPADRALMGSEGQRRVAHQLAWHYQEPGYVRVYDEMFDLDRVIVLPGPVVATAVSRNGRGRNPMSEDPAAN